MKNPIEIETLSKTYITGEFSVKALKNISISIADGEFVAIMGASGSGKSTLLNILGCLDTPTNGICRIDGVNTSDLTKNSLAEMRNSKLGFIFQAYNLLPRTSAVENVELPLLYNPRIKAKERRERAVAAIHQVGLEDRMHHRPNQLSGGQQQRVAIARSLVNDPAIILADEATGNLDTKTSLEIMALMQKLNYEGKTIVFVTHESDIAKLMKRSIEFRDGKIVSDKINVNQLCAAEMLEQINRVND